MFRPRFDSASLLRYCDLVNLSSKACLTRAHWRQRRHRCPSPRWDLPRSCPSVWLIHVSLDSSYHGLRLTDSTGLSRDSTRDPCPALYLDPGGHRQGVDSGPERNHAVFGHLNPGRTRFAWHRRARGIRLVLGRSRRCATHHCDLEPDWQRNDGTDA
jgi:hypothetical protein